MATTSSTAVGGERRTQTILSVILAVVCVIWVLPVVSVIINSFKLNTYVKTDTFALPTEESFAGLSNFVNGMTFGNYPFLMCIFYSALITIVSTFLILLFCSMAAWYVARVNSKFCKVIYYLCIFSMVVPFQMVMFPTSSIADRLGLATPWGMVLLYLGFGGGLSVFLFSGFVKSIPLEIEEASYIDGCSPLQNYFRVVMPLLKPTAVTVAILNTMWVWNDFLLPYLVIGSDERYKTIPIVIQGMIGTNGNKDLGAQMAVLVMAVIPIVVFYLACQKYIVEGVAAGAVKG